MKGKKGQNSAWCKVSLNLTKKLFFALAQQREYSNQNENIPFGNSYPTLAQERIL
jgi:hypothetical protein